MKAEVQPWMKEDSLDATTTDQLLTPPSNKAITLQDGQISSLATETASFQKTLNWWMQGNF